MGRLRAKQDYESLRNARISQNKAGIESLGPNNHSPIISSSESIKRVKRSISESSIPLRRSGRLKGKSCDFDSSPTREPLEEVGDHSKPVQRNSIDSCKKEDPLEEIGDHSDPLQRNSIDSIKTEEDARFDDQSSAISDYESLRNARISENKARLASLGLNRSIKELESILFPAKTSTKSCKNTKKSKLDLATPTRQSDRLKAISSDVDGSATKVLALYDERDELSEGVQRRLFPKAERCASKARGSIYDPVFGICCHFCRQKKLCGEEDCKRCGDRDINQPCIGKTECSVCRSSNGVLCRACLKIRYGEEMEEVRKNNDWMCPHCIEEKGINPYWICNSSLCLKKRKMVPTGIAIYQAREEGYKSVAHSIMDKLKQKAGVVDDDETAKIN